MSFARDEASLRDQRIREMVQAILEKQVSDAQLGELSNASDIDLLPELAEQLRACLARSEVLSVISATREFGHDGRLKIRCPHCQEAVSADTDSGFGDVTCPACGSSFGLVGDATENSDLSPGALVGRFELLRQCGQGGFGTVWEAHDPHLDRIVALKIPRRGDLTAAEAELFLREARAAAQIRHPHIVAIHEVGRDGDRIYLVSDFISGHSLAAHLIRERCSLGHAVELAATMAETLHFVHENNVVHRDLKPSNILLDVEGKPYLADFGLSTPDDKRHDPHM